MHNLPTSLGKKEGHKESKMNPRVHAHPSHYAATEALTANCSIFYYAKLLLHVHPSHYAATEDCSMYYETTHSSRPYLESASREGLETFHL